MKIGILLLSALALAGCQRPGPDYGPIGSGLGVLGLSIIVAAVVVSTIGRKGGQ